MWKVLCFSLAGEDFFLVACFLVLCAFILLVVSFFFDFILCQTKRINVLRQARKDGVGEREGVGDGEGDN